MAVYIKRRSITSDERFLAGLPLSIVLIVVTTFPLHHI